MVAVIGVGCAGRQSGLNQTSITCPPARTLLDGVCVSETVADYVACVRAQGATLDGGRAEKLSADVGGYGVRAAGASEVSEQLEKKYSASDQAVLEIVRACSSASGLKPAEGSTIKRVIPPDLECTGSGLIQQLTDACVDDYGASSNGDALEVFCFAGMVRFCLSGEACPWRGTSGAADDQTCSSGGLPPDGHMATVISGCKGWKGHAEYWCTDGHVRLQ